MSALEIMCGVVPGLLLYAVGITRHAFEMKAKIRRCETAMRDTIDIIETYYGTDNRMSGVYTQLRIAVGDWP